MKPKVKTVSRDGRAKLQKSLAALVKKRVLVGIPEDHTRRQQGKATNAQLLYIHTHGSALLAIPKRPVIEPAIADAHAVITGELGQAAQAVLDGDRAQANASLKRAGLAGANAAKRWFTNPQNAWPPNAPSTVAQKGSSRPLIDTGQLRRSITYVVEDED